MKSIKEILGVENYTGHNCLNYVTVMFSILTHNISFDKRYQSSNNQTSVIILSKLDSDNLSSAIDKSGSARHKPLSADNKLLSGTNIFISAVNICGSVRNILISVNNKFISGYNKLISRCDKEESGSEKLISALNKSISGSNMLFSAINMPIYWFGKECLPSNKLATDLIIRISGKYKTHILIINN